ncbi:MAG: hypothetical protein IPL83_07680 [Bdellovibrionales bacterium]|nr:hypothetical protein [Bdellovibrionales bacterium]
MDGWQSATDPDRFTHEVIAVIFRNHPKLLEFYFEDRRPRIRFQAMEMRRHAACFSSGEKQWIRVAWMSGAARAMPRFGSFWRHWTLAILVTCWRHWENCEVGRAPIKIPHLGVGAEAALSLLVSPTGLRRL